VSAGEPATLRAARYHLEAGGQRVRARLALHACEALGVVGDQAVRLAACVELLHNASLVHDDLQDKGKLRRGLPTVCAAFGPDVALCTGDLLLSAAYGALADLPDPTHLPALLRCVHARTAQVIQGQCSELATKDYALAEVSRYEEIVVGKSGVLLSLPLELAFLAARQEQWLPRIRAAAHAFGIGYQMVDDLEDVQGDAAQHSLNIVLLLAAGRPPELAADQARQMARGHLEAAIEHAGALPNKAGALLAEFAFALVKRVKSA
jgi:geranylgeranyl diphosphate synthase type II